MSVRVEDLMTRDLVVAGFEETVGEARDKMVTHGIGAVPVLNREGALMGIVTSTDLLADFEATLPIPRVMATRVHALAVGTDVREAARMMREYRHHHVVIVENDRVVGMLSAWDLLPLVAEED